jgi:hypothetical protein
VKVFRAHLDTKYSPSEAVDDQGDLPRCEERGQLSCGGTSRISREAYVRFCEGLGVKFPGPTRHSRHFPLSRRVRFAPRAERLLGRPAAGGLPLSGAAAVKGTPHRSSRCCRSATVPRSRARWRRRCAGRGLSPSPHGDLDIISKPGNASFANCCQLRCQIGFFGLFALAVSHLSL